MKNAINSHKHISAIETVPLNFNRNFQVKNWFHPHYAKQLPDDHKLAINYPSKQGTLINEISQILSKRTYDAQLFVPKEASKPPLILVTTPPSCPIDWLPFHPNEIIASLQISPEEQARLSIGCLIEDPANWKIYYDNNLILEITRADTLHPLEFDAKYQTMTSEGAFEVSFREPFTYSEDYCEKRNLLCTSTLNSTPTYVEMMDLLNHGKQLDNPFYITDNHLERTILTQLSDAIKLKNAPTVLTLLNGLKKDQNKPYLMPLVLRTLEMLNKEGCFAENRLEIIDGFKADIAMADFLLQMIEEPDKTPASLILKVSIDEPKDPRDLRTRYLKLKLDNEPDLSQKEGFFFESHLNRMLEPIQNCAQALRHLYAFSKTCVVPTATFKQEWNTLSDHIDQSLVTMGVPSLPPINSSASPQNWVLGLQKRFLKSLELSTRYVLKQSDKLLTVDDTLSKLAWTMLDAYQVVLSFQNTPEDGPEYDLCRTTANKIKESGFDALEGFLQELSTHQTENPFKQYYRAILYRLVHNINSRSNTPEEAQPANARPSTPASPIRKAPPPQTLSPERFCAMEAIPEVCQDDLGIEPRVHMKAITLHVDTDLAAPDLPEDLSTTDLSTVIHDIQIYQEQFELYLGLLDDPDIALTCDKAEIDLKTHLQKRISDCKKKLSLCNDAKIDTFLKPLWDHLEVKLPGHFSGSLRNRLATLSMWATRDLKLGNILINDLSALSQTIRYEVAALVQDESLKILLDNLDEKLTYSITRRRLNIKAKETFNDYMRPLFELFKDHNHGQPMAMNKLLNRLQVIDRFSLNLANDPAFVEVCESTLRKLTQLCDSGIEDCKTKTDKILPTKALLGHIVQRLQFINSKSNNAIEKYEAALEKFKEVEARLDSSSAIDAKALSVTLNDWTLTLADLKRLQKHLRVTVKIDEELDANLAMLHQGIADKRKQLLSDHAKLSKIHKVIQKAEQRLFGLTRYLLDFQLIETLTRVEVDRLINRYRGVKLLGLFNQAKSVDKPMFSRIKLPDYMDNSLLTGLLEALEEKQQRQVEDNPIALDIDPDAEQRQQDLAQFSKAISTVSAAPEIWEHLANFKQSTIEKLSPFDCIALMKLIAQLADLQIAALKNEPSADEMSQIKLPIAYSDLSKFSNPDHQANCYDLLFQHVIKAELTTNKFGNTWLENSDFQALFPGFNLKQRFEMMSACLHEQIYHDYAPSTEVVDMLKETAEDVFLDTKHLKKANKEIKARFLMMLLMVGPTDIDSDRLTQRICNMLPQGSDDTNKDRWACMRNIMEFVGALPDQVALPIYQRIQLASNGNLCRLLSPNQPKNTAEMEAELLHHLNLANLDSKNIISISPEFRSATQALVKTLKTQPDSSSNSKLIARMAEHVICKSTAELIEKHHGYGPFIQEFYALESQINTHKDKLSDQEAYMMTVILQRFNDITKVVNASFSQFTLTDNFQYARNSLSRLRWMAHFGPANRLSKPAFMAFMGSALTQCPVNQTANPKIADWVTQKKLELVHQNTFSQYFQLGSKPLEDVGPDALRCVCEVFETHIGELVRNPNQGYFHTLSEIGNMLARALSATFGPSSPNEALLRFKPVVPILTRCFKELNHLSPFQIKALLNNPAARSFIVMLSGLSGIHQHLYASVYEPDTDDTELLAEVNNFQNTILTKLALEDTVFLPLMDGALSMALQYKELQDNLRLQTIPGYTPKLTTDQCQAVPLAFITAISPWMTKASEAMLNHLKPLLKDLGVQLAKKTVVNTQKQLSPFIEAAQAGRKQSIAALQLAASESQETRSAKIQDAITNDPENTKLPELWRSYQGYDIQDASFNTALNIFKKGFASRPDRFNQLLSKLDPLERDRLTRCVSLDWIGTAITWHLKQEDAARQKKNEQAKNNHQTCIMYLLHSTTQQPYANRLQMHIPPALSNAISMLVTERLPHDTPSTFYLLSLLFKSRQGLFSEILHTYRMPDNTPILAHYLNACVKPFNELAATYRAELDKEEKTSLLSDWPNLEELQSTVRPLYQRSPEDPGAIETLHLMVDQCHFNYLTTAIANFNPFPHLNDTPYAFKDFLDFSFQLLSLPKLYTKGDDKKLYRLPLPMDALLIGFLAYPDLKLLQKLYPMLNFAASYSKTIEVRCADDMLPFENDHILGFKNPELVLRHCIKLIHSDFRYTQLLKEFESNGFMGFDYPEAKVLMLQP